jgi:hypothetical protein
MRSLALATGFALALFAGWGAIAAPAPPRGWRELTPTEIADLHRRAERGIGQPVNQTVSIEADFDGDGRMDRAVLLVNDKVARFALFVSRAAARHYQRLDYDGPLEGLWNYGLQVQPSGVFETACAKGLGDDAEPCRRRVRTRWPAIGANDYEASYAVFFWDGRRFDSEYLSD